MQINLQPDIDSTIIPSTTAEYEYQASLGSDVTAYFNDPEESYEHLVAVQSGDKLVRMALRGMEPTSCVVEGTCIVYPDAFIDTDIYYNTSQGELKEDIVMASTAAPHEFSFDLETVGVTAELQEDCSINYLDEAGSTIWTIVAPYATDAAGRNVEVSMVYGEGMYQLTVVPDADTVYPVTLDPTITTPTTAVVNWMSTSYAGQTMNNNTDIHFVDHLGFLPTQITFDIVRSKRTGTGTSCSSSATCYTAAGATIGTAASSYMPSASTSESTTMVLNVPAGAAYVRVNNYVYRNSTTGTVQSISKVAIKSIVTADPAYLQYIPLTGTISSETKTFSFVVAKSCIVRKIFIHTALNMSYADQTYTSYRAAEVSAVTVDGVTATPTEFTANEGQTVVVSYNVPNPGSYAKTVSYATIAGEEYSAPVNIEDNVVFDLFRQISVSDAITGDTSRVVTHSSSSTYDTLRQTTVQAILESDTLRHAVVDAVALSDTERQIVKMDAQTITGDTLRRVVSNDAPKIDTFRVVTMADQVIADTKRTVVKAYEAVSDTMRKIAATIEAIMDTQRTVGRMGPWHIDDFSPWASATEHIVTNAEGITLATVPVVLNYFGLSMTSDWTYTNPAGGGTGSTTKTFISNAAGSELWFWASKSSDTSRTGDIFNIWLNGVKVYTRTNMYNYAIDFKYTLTKDVQYTMVAEYICGAGNTKTSQRPTGMGGQINDYGTIGQATEGSVYSQPINITTMPPGPLRFVVTRTPASTQFVYAPISLYYAVNGGSTWTKATYSPVTYDNVDTHVTVYEIRGDIQNATSIQFRADLLGTTTESPVLKTAEIWISETAGERVTVLIDTLRRAVKAVTAPVDTVRRVTKAAQAASDTKRRVSKSASIAADTRRSISAQITALLDTARSTMAAQEVAADTTRRTAAQDQAVMDTLREVVRQNWDIISVDTQRKVVRNAAPKMDTKRKTIKNASVTMDTKRVVVEIATMVGDTRRTVVYGSTLTMDTLRSIIKDQSITADTLRRIAAEDEALADTLRMSYSILGQGAIYLTASFLADDFAVLRLQKQ